MYKTLIVDDNKVARTMLAEMLKKIDGIKIAGEFEDAPSAISAIKKGEVDILFLDVEMPGMSGIELLRMLPQKPISILVSAKPAYAVEAFELNVVDFLVKPLSIPRVIAAVERAKELLTQKNTNVNAVENDYVFIKDGKTIRKIEIQSILWLEAKGDYVKIATQNGNYVIHSTLSSLEEKLFGKEFFRIHRGYIIPLNKIDYIEDGVAHIQGTPLPVSENYKSALIKQLKLF